MPFSRPELRELMARGQQEWAALEGLTWTGAVLEQHRTTRDFLLAQTSCGSPGESILPLSLGAWPVCSPCPPARAQ